MAPAIDSGNVRVRVFLFQLDGYCWSYQRMDRLATVRSEQFNQREISGTLPVTYSRDSRPWLSSVFEYVVRLGLSILGTLGFALCLFLLGMLLYQRGLPES